MLSVLIRARNEEKNIQRVIKSAQPIADEIIVLDSGSKDNTVALAKELGAKVFFKEWEGYSKQLNYGLSLCQGEWVLILDADEELTRDLRSSIKQAIASQEYQVYMLNRRTYYLGRFLSHAWQPEWRVRLFKKGAVRFEGELHERAIYFGKAGKLKGYLNHYSFKSLHHHYIKSIEYAKIMARSMKREGKGFKLYNLLINPLWDAFKVYFLKLGFLDGVRGLSVAFSTFFYVFLKYLFLLELELEERYGEELWK
ncbi:glycosyltransferase family 2 protein [Hydrogenobacter thermophilus]|uniref:glycosyltransferase family 2 protein n=1 Tax=Hydrogenobacter thermophilus TaxID=940 RepID=UPI0030F561D8